MPPRQRFYGDWRESFGRSDIKLPFTLIDPRGEVVMGGIPGTNPVQMVPLVCRLTPAEVRKYEAQKYTVVNVDSPEGKVRKDLE